MKHNLFFCFQMRHSVLQYILDYYEILCPFAFSPFIGTKMQDVLMMEEQNEITSGIYR